MSKSFGTIVALISFLATMLISFWVPLSLINTILITISVLIVIISGLISIINRFFSLNKLLAYWPSLVIASKKLVIIFLIMVLSGILASLRMKIVFVPKSNNHVSNFYEQNVELIGKIDEEIDVRNDRIKYTVAVNKINNQVASGRILLNANKFPMYQYGDVLQITGKIDKPPVGEKFSYQDYLSRYEIYGIMEKANIQYLTNEPNSVILAFLFQQKRAFLDRLNQLYSEPYASFLAGLLIGARKGMSADIMQDFQITGLSHIVAVSGSNITIILAIILTVLAFLPRIVAMIVAIVFIIGFTIFVGMSAAVVRAACMGIIGLFAVQMGRPKASFIALLTTITIMVIYQPKILIFDVGFQLSVLAVIGVIWLVPLLPNFFQKLPNQFGIKEAIALTIAAQITTLPISVMNFQAFSLIAPVANLLVVPFIPLAMLFGFISMVPIPLISELTAFITFVMLKSSLWFAHFFAQIPYAQINNIQLPSWIWIIYFLILAGILIKKNRSLSS